MYLKKALAAGAGPEARLLYVESLLGVGRSDEAAAEMKRYLDGRDVKKNAGSGSSSVGERSESGKG